MGACPHHRKSIFVTATLVSLFCFWTPLRTSVCQTPWFVPLSKFLATPLSIFDFLLCLGVHLQLSPINYTDFSPPWGCTCTQCPLATPCRNCVSCDADYTIMMMMMWMMMMLTWCRSTTSTRSGWQFCR